MRIPVAAAAQVSFFDPEFVCPGCIEPVRHSPRGATVRLGLDPDGTCTVTDAGPGIPEGLRERVFDKYVSVKGEGERGSNRGLGLTFVQLAAVAHGGSVRVHCPPEGGSRFSLKVPAATAHLDVQHHGGSERRSSSPE